MSANVTNNNRVQTEEQVIGQLFLLEDSLERDLQQGLISYDEYQQGINRIYHNISDLYGFTS